MTGIGERRGTCFVGNGSQLLLGPPLGPRIDACARVFRFNGFHGGGIYAARVGSRCTHWCCGVWPGLLDVLNREGVPPAARDAEEIWATAVMGRDAVGSLAWGAFCRYGRAPSIRRIRYGSLLPARLDQLAAAGLVGPLRWPTTGLLCLAAALDVWPAETIDVCGFWNGRPDSRGEYWDPTREVVGVPEHDYEAERAVIDRWVAQGRVRRLDGVGPLETGKTET